jgi:hypothetical protein
VAKFLRAARLQYRGHAGVCDGQTRSPLWVVHASSTVALIESASRKNVFISRP